jgi:hypothetical protein
MMAFYDGLELCIYRPLKGLLVPIKLSFGQEKIIWTAKIDCPQVSATSLDLKSSIGSKQKKNLVAA